jgi:hypothetical protein
MSALVPVVVLNLRALQHMYSGLLAIPHYLKDLWYCYLVVNNNIREQNNQEVAQHSSAKMVLKHRLSCNESVSSGRSIRPNYGSFFIQIEIIMWFNWVLHQALHRNACVGVGGSKVQNYCELNFN